MSNFKQTPYGNEVWQINQNTYFSYNPNPRANVGYFRSDNNSPETAMILDRKFYILNGDFREDYEREYIKDGISACITFYTTKVETHGSTWTSNSDLEKFWEQFCKRLE